MSERASARAAAVGLRLPSCAYFIPVYKLVRADTTAVWPSHHLKLSRGLGDRAAGSAESSAIREQENRAAENVLMHFFGDSQVT